MAVDARLHVNPTGDLLAAARECEADVFLHWYGNTREQLADEYGPYEDRSVYLVVSDADDDVVATMRLIAPGGEAGLKAINDLSGPPWKVDGTRAALSAGLDLDLHVGDRNPRQPATPGREPGPQLDGALPRVRGARPGQRDERLRRDPR